MEDQFSENPYAPPVAEAAKAQRRQLLLKFGKKKKLFIVSEFF